MYAVPILTHEFGTVLDLGCGTSLTALGALKMPRGSIRVGVDINKEDVTTAARQRSGGIYLLVADGHALPFRAGCFDVVFSKVALPYMDLPAAVQEIGRVLKPWGEVWMTLHPFRMAGMRLLSSLRTGQIKDVVYQLYAVLNGLSLHVFGAQFRYPLNRAKIESVQTLSAITRLLGRAGFEDIRYELRLRGPGLESKDKLFGRMLVIAARKSPPA